MECSMQSEGNAESYSGIISVPLSHVYYAHTAHGNKGKQYAERGECSMQSEGNAVCRERGMQSEGNAVYKMRRMQYAE